MKLEISIPELGFASQLHHIFNRPARNASPPASPEQARLPRGHCGQVAGGSSFTPDLSKIGLEIARYSCGITSDGWSRGFA